MICTVYTNVLIGHEFDAVFVCTSDYKDESGLISNKTKSLVTPRIFNTVMSRSRSLIVAVGNPFTLIESEKTMAEGKCCWKEFIKRCLSKRSGYLMTFKESSGGVEIEKALANEVEIKLDEEAAALVSHIQEGNVKNHN